MAKYMLLYHGGTPAASPEEGAKVMAAWQSWMGTLGKSLVDGGNPTVNARTISSDGKVGTGGGANPVTGYSILEATSADDAVMLAKGCPHLKAGGSIEVTEIMAMM